MDTALTFLAFSKKKVPLMLMPLPAVNHGVVECYILPMA